MIDLETLLRSELEALEVERLDLIKRLKRVSALLAVMLVLSLAIYPSLLFIGILGLSAWVSVVTPSRSFKKNVKRRLMPPIAAALGVNWNPHPPDFDLEGFQDLVSEYTEVRFEDGLAGEIDGAQLSLVEGELTWRSNENTRVARYLLMKIGLKKRLKSYTVIFSRSEIPGMSRTSPWDEGTEIKLEDVEFSRIFKVFSSDQIEARYLLTPVTMERLKAVDDIWPGTEYAIEKGEFCMSAPLGHDLLSGNHEFLEAPDIFQPINSRVVSLLQRDLNAFLAVARELNEATGTQA